MAYRRFPRSFKKIRRMRGGFIDGDFVKPLFRKGIDYLMGPKGQPVRRMALSAGKKMLERTFKGKDGSVSSNSPVGLFVRQAFNTPTVYGAYGTITRTNYTEGKYGLPKYIDAQSRLTTYDNGGLALSTASPLQTVGTLGYLQGSVLFSILNNLDKVDTNPAGSTNTIEGFFQLMSNETRISNSSNINATVDLYEIIPRRDITGGIYGAGNTSGTNMQSPDGSWNAGMSNAGPFNGMSGTAVNLNFYGSNPLDSEIFTNFWLIKKKFSIELPGGSTHIHTSTYNINKKLNNLVVSSGGMNSGNSFLTDFSKFLMIVVNGTPVHGTTLSSDVTVGPASIDITRTSRTVAYAIPNSVRTVLRNNTFATVTGIEQFIPTIVDTIIDAD